MSLISQKKLIAAALACILLAAVLFYFNNIKIPGEVRQAEAKVREELDINAMPKEKAFVIADKSGISKYTKLTEQIINEKIVLMDIPVKYLAQGALSDIGAIRDTIAKEDLRCGEQLVAGCLSNEEKWFGEYQRLKEYMVTSIVNDEVKAGNIIDIIVSYGNGDYDVVVPKIKVIRLTAPKETVKEESSTNNPPEYTLVVAVDEEQYRDMELAKKMGNLETRLYIDESQPASRKTFNYGSSLKKVNLSGVSKKSYNTQKINNSINADRPGQIRLGE